MIPIFISKHLTNFSKAKRIDVNTRVGHTGYIDFIEESDFPNTNIVYGYDSYDRFFLSILFLKNGKKQIMTLFQRYQEDDLKFVTCAQTISGVVDVHRFDGRPLPDEYVQFFDLINNSKLYIEYIDWDEVLVKNTYKML